jgi:HSP20 family protein
MNRLFEDATQRRVQEDADRSDEVERADWYPAADITESESQFVIAVDLPGIDRSALDISVDENRLALKGSRTIESSAEHRAERPRGRFIRTFGIPGSVDQTKIGAEYKDGVLNVILPKRMERKAKRVEIKVS